jgi:hypothetical protein
MDMKKWKSIAITVDVYEIIRQQAEKNDRSVSKQLAHIVKQSAKEKAA